MHHNKHWMDESKIFYIWEGLKALDMLICPIKRDYVKYNIRKYIFIDYNSRSKVTISAIKVMEQLSLKNLSSLIKKKMQFYCLRRQLWDYSPLWEISKNKLEMVCNSLSSLLL